MKIKALKTFVFGRFDANRGEALDVPDDAGKKLVEIGFAESVEDTVENKEKSTESVEDTVENKEESTEESNKEPVVPKKAGKAGTKTSARR